LEYGDFKCPWIEKEALWQQVKDIRAQEWGKKDVVQNYQKISISTK
jgi:hypothetical protein